MRIFGCKENAKFKNNPSVKNIVSEENTAGLFRLDRYSKFRRNVEIIKSNFLNFLTTAKAESKRVCAYGAAAKGNTLINYAGVDSDLIPFVADASNAKINKFLPGSRIPIYSPESMIEFKPDYVVILPWNIASEIKTQYSQLAKQGCKFFTFVPQIKKNLKMKIPYTKPSITNLEVEYAADAAKMVGAKNVMNIFINLKSFCRLPGS